MSLQKTRRMAASLVLVACFFLLPLSSAQALPLAASRLAPTALRGERPGLLGLVWSLVRGDWGGAVALLGEGGLSSLFADEGTSGDPDGRR